MAPCARMRAQGVIPSEGGILRTYACSRCHPFEFATLCKWGGKFWPTSSLTTWRFTFRESYIICHVLLSGSHIIYAYVDHNWNKLSPARQWAPWTRVPPSMYASPLLLLGIASDVSPPIVEKELSLIQVIASHCITFHYISLHFITLHCIRFHCISPHYIPSHFKWNVHTICDHGCFGITPDLSESK